MDGSREERRLEGDVHLDVDVRRRECRDGDDRCGEQRRVALLRHEPDERAGDFVAPLLAGGHVRQDRNRHDSHVERDHGGGNRGGESESEKDVDPHPPGDGPHQQTGPTKAKEPERGGDGENDQDVHRATAPSGVETAGPSCAPFVGPPGAGAPPGAAAPLLVAVFRLQRDSRRAAKRLEVRDHAEDLLIGEADRRLVDWGHRRRKSRRRRRSARTSIGRGTRHRSGPGRGSSRGHRFLPGRGTGALRFCRSCGRSGRVPCPP